MKFVAFSGSKNGHILGYLKKLATNSVTAAILDASFLRIYIIFLSLKS